MTDYKDILKQIQQSTGIDYSKHFAKYERSIKNLHKSGRNYKSIDSYLIKKARGYRKIAMAQAIRLNTKKASLNHLIEMDKNLTKKYLEKKYLSKHDLNKAKRITLERYRRAYMNARSKLGKEVRKHSYEILKAKYNDKSFKNFFVPNSYVVNNTTNMSLGDYINTFHLDLVNENTTKNLIADQLLSEGRLQPLAQNEVNNYTYGYYDEELKIVISPV